MIGINSDLKVLHGGLFFLPVMPSVSVMTQDCTVMEDSYMETADTAASGPPATPQEGSKLPPVLANLMVSLNSNRSPQAQSNAPPPSNPAMNVQELLSSIMVCFPASPPVAFLLMRVFLGQWLICLSLMCFLGGSGV